MSQPYKLRLSDGTVLLVDQEGLSTWLVDQKAMVQAAGSQQWRPLREFLAEERVAALRASRRKPSLRDAPPLVPPTPREVDEPSPAVSPPPHLVDPPFSSEASRVQVLAEDPGGAGAQSTPQQTPNDEIPVIPFKPLADEAPAHPTVSSWLDSLETPSVSAGSTVQVLADDPAAPAAGYTREPSTPDDSLPIIPLKPFADGPLARAAMEPATGEDEGDAFVPEAPEAPPRERPRGAAMRAASALGAFLSRFLAPISRLERGLPLMSPDEPVPRQAGSSWRSTPSESPPSALTATQWRTVRSWVSGWIDGLTAWVSRLVHPERRRPSLDTPEAFRVAGSTDPAPREPLKPPPPASELPALPFAEVDEAEEEEDIYDEAEEGEGLVHTAWLWMKWIVVIVGLVAGGVLVAQNWESWTPKVVLLGRIAFTEIDKHVRALEQAKQHKQALAEAAEQLPHLAPETIQLVLSSSPTGLLDPAEVFQIACQAADRGLPALTSAEVEELGALRRELLDSLSRAERERIREYDSTRARRVTFAFEDRAALEPFARGARALPAQDRERLQSLLGKAVAAGLVLPAAARPPHPTDR